MENVGLKVVLELEAEKATRGVKSFANAVSTDINNAAKKADQSIGKLNLTIEELRAKIAARQEFLIKTSDITKIAKYNQEIEQLSAELTKAANIGKTGFDQFGNKIEAAGNKVEKTAKQTNALGKGFSFIRQAAYLLPGIGIAGIFNEIGEAVVALIGELSKGTGHFEEMSKVLGNAAEESYKAKEKFSGLIARISDGNASFKAQSDALKETNALLKDYGVQIDSVASAQKYGAAIGGLYADLKKEEAKQIALAGLAGKEYAKQIELQFAAQQGNLVDVTKSIGFFNILKEVIKSGGTATGTATAASKAFSEQIIKSGDAMAFFEGKVNDSKHQVEVIMSLLRLFTKPVEEVEKGAKKAAKSVEELGRAYRGLLGALDSSGSLANNRLIIEVATKFKQDEIKKNVEDLVKFVNVLPQPTVHLRMDTNLRKLVDDLNKVKGEVRNFAGEIQGVISNAIASAAEGIGAAIAGSQNSLSAFIGVIANGLATIGQAMIAFGTAKIALSKLNLSGPAALAIGIGLEILSGILKAKVAQVKFADGGIVTGPTNALIGEAGPEVVFPLDRIREFMGNDRGSMQPIVLTTAVRGSDLLLVQQRAGASYGRTNG